MKKIKKFINFIARPSVCYWLCFLAGCLLGYLCYSKIRNINWLDVCALYVGGCWFMSALAHINFFKVETELKDWTIRFILWLISPIALLIFINVLGVSMVLKETKIMNQSETAIMYLYKELFLWA